jgi:tRNA (cmo5U34)-methyltransferase
MLEENRLPKRFSQTIGDDYDLFKLGCDYHDEFQIETIKQISRVFGDTKSLKVLEIGFGTGITSAEILSQSDCNLIGIDNESKMLEKANLNLNSFLGRYELITTEALEYLKKQKADSFDVVVNVWVLHNIPLEIRLQIIKEIFRVLRSGGLFLNGDKIASDELPLHKIQLDLQFKMFDKFSEIGRKDLQKEWTEHYLEDDKPSKKLIQKEFIDFLIQIGFSKVEAIKRYNLDLILTAIK